MERMDFRVMKNLDLTLGSAIYELSLYLSKFIFTA